MEQAAGRVLRGRSLTLAHVLLLTPTILAGEDRGRQRLPPGKPKCQLRDFGSGDVFSNPNPTVTKTKASHPPPLPSLEPAHEAVRPPRPAEGRRRARACYIPPDGNDRPRASTDVPAEPAACVRVD